jgi:tRNA A58 N-methylase Trm61
MLEKIGTVTYATVSRRNENSVRICRDIVASGVEHPMVAEIGVGVGATTLAMSEVLKNMGEIHIYDFHDAVDDLRQDLSKLGYNNIKTFGNTKTYWDSYNWNLAKNVMEWKEPLYDYIYLDGSHTLFVDGLSFFLCDRLLKPGGILEFDDYNWTFAQSSWMKSVRESYMTEEQIATKQVAMVIDLFVSKNEGYTTIIENRLFKKKLNHA